MRKEVSVNSEMKVYETPEAEILRLDGEDVFRASGDNETPVIPIG